MRPSSEYQQLVYDLPRLAEAFGDRVPTRVARDLRIFMAALEQIDHELDDLPSAAQRAAFGQGVIAALRGAAPLPGLLGKKVQRLRVALQRRRQLDRFVRLSMGALRNAEAMRTSPSPSEYVERVRLEGRYTIELVLLFHAEASEELRRFLREVASLANLYDKIADAREDFRRGHCALPPRPGLYGVLVRAAVADGWYVARSHPDLFALARWATGYLWMLAPRARQNARPASRRRAAAAPASRGARPGATTRHEKPPPSTVGKPVTAA